MLTLISSFLTEFLDSILFKVSTRKAIRSRNSSSITSSSTFFNSAPIILSLWTSSSLLNWYSYFRSFVWSNSEILL